jgi:hypothetical protein
VGTKRNKISAIRKNRRENSSHADFFGSNPHSNGDLFSRSSIFFFYKSDVNTTTAVVNIIVMVVAVITFDITYLVSYKLLDWKSSILIIQGAAN